jgi:hypothetical protein
MEVTIAVQSIAADYGIWKSLVQGQRFEWAKVSE